LGLFFVHHTQKGEKMMQSMSKDELVAKMVALGVRYSPGLFPNGAWKQEGNVLSAHAGEIFVGQYDDATGRGWFLDA
jgi:hypothetical protein